MPLLGSLGQSQTLLQKQTLSLRQIQYVKILQMSTPELNSYLNEYQLENPVVEVEPPSLPLSDDPDADLLHSLAGWLNSGVPAGGQAVSEEEEFSSYENLARPADEEHGNLQKFLTSQFDFSLARLDLRLLDFIIHSLDESGYLIYTAEQISAATGTDLQLVREGIAYLQSLDPPGIGARDLSECLRLQLERLGVREEAAYRMVESHLEDMAAGWFTKISKALGVSAGEVKRLYGIIRQLTPRPAGAFGGGQTPYIVPDVTVRVNGDQIACSFNKGYGASMRISSFYLGIGKEDRDAYDYVSQKISQALWVIKAIEKRQSTIERIVSILVQQQRNFFLSPGGTLRPMSLRDLAARMEVHESTVSRAISEKFLLCDKGAFPLKFFFSGELKPNARRPLPAASQPVSRESVRSMLRDLIAAEDPKNPLCDNELAALLAQRGVSIARRTVAKYRDQLGVPPVSLRAVKG